MEAVRPELRAGLNHYGRRKAVMEAARPELRAGLNHYGRWKAVMERAARNYVPG